ncbi:MAG: MaoC family dehydratase N-terminal domain-containing protein [Dehalococcoidia bacterium]|nr:MaoC family dehydratase N-terminal domain-containing protein [Dehalococcoidia bacterium]
MVQPSMITDDMRKSIGVILGTQTVEVDKRWIIRFTEVMDDSNPLYDEQAAKEGPYGELIAPPSFVYGFHISGRPQGIFRMPVDIPSPPVDGGGEWEFFEPVRPGDVITITTKISDLYEREGKSGALLFVIHELECKNQKGQLVCRYRMTHICRQVLEREN